MTPDAFLDALREDPDDDTTRLVYADWLDDHGDVARAEFIRLRVRFERLPVGHEDRTPLANAAHALQVAHAAEWLGPRPKTLEQVTWRGGLVSGLQFRYDATLADVEPLLRRHPVTELILPMDDVAGELARSPALAQIRSLHLSMSYRAGPFLDRLLCSPHLRLEKLVLLGDVVDDYVARFLPRCLGLRNLRALQLSSNRLSDAGVVQMLKPGAFPKLEDWFVIAPHVSRVGMNHLLAPHRAGRWTKLYWGATRPNPSEYPAASPRLDLGRCTALRELTVVPPDRHHWYDGPVLAGLDELRQLRVLNLAGPVGEADLEQLVQWRGLHRLERLVIQMLSEEARARLAASPYRNRATEWVA